MSDIKFGFDEYCAEVKEYTDAFFAREGHRPRAFVRTFGCQQNEADSERLRGTLVLLGYELCDNENEADCILVNTCAIREHAEKRALSIVGQYKHFKEKNKDLIIGVCGCMVAQEHRREELRRSYPYVDLVFGTTVLHEFPTLLLEKMEAGRRRFCADVADHVVPEQMPVVRESN